MVLLDIHTHNSSSEVYAADESVISIISTTPLSYSSTQSYENQFYSCGIHPWYSDNWAEQLDSLTSILSHNNVVAIGEAGLDRLHGLDIDIQIEVFKQQILLSEDLCKPIIIHCVRAWDVLLALNKEMKPSQPWIVHGFRGKPQLAQQLLDANMYLSFGERFNPESVRVTDISKLFVETDESTTSIYNIYNNVAGVLNLSVEDLAQHTMDNFTTVFKGIR